jgi:hypothetical protein
LAHRWSHVSYSETGRCEVYWPLAYSCGTHCPIQCGVAWNSEVGSPGLSTHIPLAGKDYVLAGKDYQTEWTFLNVPSAYCLPVFCAGKFITCSCGAGTIQQDSLRCWSRSVPYASVLTPVTGAGLNVQTVYEAVSRSILGESSGPCPVAVYLNFLLTVGSGPFIEWVESCQE